MACARVITTREPSGLMPNQVEPLCGFSQPTNSVPGLAAPLADGLEPPTVGFSRPGAINAGTRAACMPFVICWLMPPMNRR